MSTEIIHCHQICTTGNSKRHCSSEGGIIVGGRLDLHKIKCKEEYWKWYGSG